MRVSEAKKVNRGHLLRAAKKGNLYVKCSFHYTDDYAWDNAVGFGKMDEFVQVYLRPEHESKVGKAIEAIYANGGNHMDAEPLMELQRVDWREWSKQHEEKARGMLTLEAWDFRTKSGCMNGDESSGYFNIHSNLSYEYEIRS